MDGLREWAFGLCAAAIACGLMRILTPKSSMEHVFSAVVSVFFLGCILSPILLGTIDADISLTSPDELREQLEQRTRGLEDTLNDEFTESASESIRLAAQQTLEEMGVDYRNIYIHTNENEQNSISISECEVTLDASYQSRHTQIREALMARLGVAVSIGYVKE